MQKGITKQLLLSNNYWVLNKSMVKIFGLETAFLLSNFAEAEQLMADDDGWFYQTSDVVEEMTTLSRHKQDQCIKQLEELGILEKEIRGLPAKRYFRINEERLTNKFVNFLQTRLPKIDKLDCKKLTTNKEHINKEHINKEHINKEHINKELIKDIAEEQPKETPIYKEVIDYLNSKADKSYRHTGKKTQSLIDARQNEGFELKDFLKVIDNKVHSWKGGDMDKYLRPETIFSNKFEGYLNENIKAKDKKHDTKFHVTNNRTSNYNADELEDIAARKRREYRERMKSN